MTRDGAGFAPSAAFGKLGICSAAGPGVRAAA